MAREAVLKSRPTPPPSNLLAILPDVVRSRIPVLASLRRTAQMSVLQRFDRSGPVTPLSRQNSDASRSASSSATSGSVTPRSESPDTLEIVPFEPLPATQRDVTTMKWCAADIAIDAVKYMHMALPQDLSEAEIASLRATMPQDVLYQSVRRKNTAGPNTLRRTVAQIVAWAMAIAFFVLPLLLTLLNGLLKYEREHRVVQRVLANSVNAVNGIGEYGGQVQTSLVRLRNGPMGRLLVGTTAYVAEGIGGGVIDGYRDAQADSRSPCRQVACKPERGK